jgi:hypothetical protein
MKLEDDHTEAGLTERNIGVIARLEHARAHVDHWNGNCRSIDAASLASESRREIDLPQPAALGTIQRPYVVHFDDGITEGVRPECYSRAAHPVAIAGGRRRARISI